MLATDGMIASNEEIELDHLDRVAGVAATGNDIAPLTVEKQEAEVEECVRDEQPHHGEMPVTGAAEPTAEGEPVGNRVAFPRIEREVLTRTGERGVRVEDAHPAAGHDHDGHDVHPVREPDDPMVTLDEIGHASVCSAC